MVLKILSVLAYDLPVSTPQNSCQSGANVALTRKMADGTYYAYFPFAILTEASQ